MKKIIIAAVSKNNVIGKDGKLPWHSKEELQHFKKITIGFPVIMGRKTWEVLGKPLEGRLNIVVTNNQDYTAPYREVVFFYSLKQALDFCKTSVYSKVFIIGGREIFNQIVDDADEMIISEMNFESEGDVYFPEVDGTKWQLDSNELFTDFTVHYYIRR
ncbi:diacylglycerol kinase [bacterium]|nr:diacylglycerol kinase [bacterium]